MSLAPFEQVVREHGGAVLRVCRALLDPVEADDAWSETFLSALRAYPDLEDDQHLRGCSSPSLIDGPSTGFARPAGDPNRSASGPTR